MCVFFTSNENKSSLFFGKNADHPKRMVDFPLGKGRFPETVMEIVNFAFFEFFIFLYFVIFSCSFTFLLFFFFFFFFFLFLFLFFSRPSKRETTKKKRRTVCFVKKTIFLCENLIFGPRWTGRGAGLGMVHLRVSISFLLTNVCFFFLLRFFLSIISLLALVSEFNCRCFLSGGAPWRCGVMTT